VVSRDQHATSPDGIAGWPDMADNVSLPGSRIASVVVDHTMRDTGDGALRLFGRSRPPLLFRPCGCSPL